MPKEYIQNDARQGGDHSHHIEVVWARDKYLQMASVCKGEEAADGQPYRAPEGWYVNLGRAEVNRLIRILRRARDQAFGADA